MTKTRGNVLKFFKRNLAYFILALCIIAIGLSVTFAVLSAKNSKLPSGNDNGEIINPVPDDVGNGDSSTDGEVNGDLNNQPVVEIITFIMPVSEPNSIAEYSESMVFNGTLNRYSVHKAIDFYAEEGSSVYAVWGGTVESVTNDILKGVTVTVDHGNGLKTVYNSLADVDAVTEGQKVNKGDVIGEVSVTNRQESGAGAHLHFETYENGEVIDPVKYLALDEK